MMVPTGALLFHAARSSERRKTPMTLCPIALAVGCKKCPVFAVCPVKGVIGDYRKQEETSTERPMHDEKK
jgi:hypothetical protein